MEEYIMKKKRDPIWTVAGILIIAVLGISLFSMLGFVQVGDVDWSVAPPKDKETGLPSTCPTTGSTTLTLTVQNTLNTTGSESFDVAGKLNTQTVADTTAGSYTLNCGEEQTLKLIAGDADGGDNSKTLSVLSYSGMTAPEVTSDGFVKFTPTSATGTLIVGGYQHGTMESRWYDKDAAGWIYNAAPFDNDATDYEATGVSFQSTTNATAKVVGENGEINYRGDIRADSVDEEFCDYYCLFAIEAPVATWNIPVLKADGTQLTDVKGSLTTYEEKALSSYEYIYKYTGGIDYYGISVDLTLRALSGVNPSVAPELDTFSAGNYLSLNGVDIKNGAADDTSSVSAVFTKHDILFDIS